MTVLYHDTTAGKRKMIKLTEKVNPTVIRIGMATYVFRCSDKSYLTIG